MSVSGEVGVVNQIEFQGRSFAGASVSNYGVVETGDVVYTKSPLRANPYGIIKANKGKSGIVSTLYAVYKTIQGTANADFIECYFDLDDRLNMYLNSTKLALSLQSSIPLSPFISVSVFRSILAAKALKQLKKQFLGNSVSCLKYPKKYLRKIKIWWLMRCLLTLRSLA